MVRALNVSFDDEDYVKLEREKEASGLTWRDFILARCLGRDEGG